MIAYKWFVNRRQAVWFCKSEAGSGTFQLMDSAQFFSILFLRVVAALLLPISYAFYSKTTPTSTIIFAQQANHQISSEKTANPHNWDLVTECLFIYWLWMIYLSPVSLWTSMCHNCYLPKNPVVLLVLKIFFCKTEWYDSHYHHHHHTQWKLFLWNKTIFKCIPRVLYKHL